jgi:predicted ATPase/DNA-binding SARP family transcriptional activator
LLAGEAEPVPDATLIEAIWNSPTPPNDTNALPVVVSRTRAILGGDQRDRLRRTESGYLLDVPLGDTDHGQFTDRIAQSTRLLAKDQLDEAIRNYEAALSLWRGHPWSDLADSQLVTAAVTRLHELYEVAVEEHAAALLARGDTTHAIARLSQAAVAAPYRERRWELLALGLYRAGRQVQALAELRRVRRLLIDELGVEPGPALKSMEQRILEQDPGLLRIESGSAPILARREQPSPQVRRPLTSFVGRESELTRLAELFTGHHLVTVVGPAGVGKTRLAIEFTTHAQPVTETWYAQLADTQIGESVAVVVAAAIGVQQHGDDQPAAIAAALAHRQGLLILDNCEHIIETAADLAVTLLAACPQLRILATSRRTLHIAGENVLALEPLAVVDPAGKPGDAVRLLLDRVNASRPGWLPSDSENLAAQEICTLLDGLPLAIELAAARERAFGLHDLATHLRDGLHVLGATPRGSVTPHANLMAAIAWSVDQLDPADRALLLRLWPFEHGLTWRAIDAVTPSDSWPAVLAGLASLVDRSVITSEIDHDQARYRMLETVRHYCRTVDPNPAATREAHAAWARATAIENATMLEGPGATEAIQTLRAELPNIRAAIRFDLQHKPIEALRTASCLELAWVLLGHQVEGTQLIRAALDACPSASAEDRAAGLLALSFSASHGGAAATGVQLASAALELLGAPSTAPQAALHLRALHFRGAAIMDLGDLAGARDAVAQVREALERMPAPPYFPALHVLGEGMLLLMERDPTATDVLRRARDAAQDCGSLWIEGLSDWLQALGLLDRAPADPRLARDALALLDRALVVFRRQENVCDILATLYHGAHALAVLDQPDVAAELHAAVVRHGIRTGTNPRRYARLADPFTQQRAAEVQQHRQHDTDDPAAPLLSWDDMLDRFTTSARQITPRPQVSHLDFSA